MAVFQLLPEADKPILRLPQIAKTGVHYPLLLYLFKLHHIPQSYLINPSNPIPETEGAHSTLAKFTLLILI